MPANRLGIDNGVHGCSHRIERNVLTPHISRYSLAAVELCFTGFGSDCVRRLPMGYPLFSLGSYQRGADCRWHHTSCLVRSSCSTLPTSFDDDIYERAGPFELSDHSSHSKFLFSQSISSSPVGRTPGSVTHPIQAVSHFCSVSRSFS